MVGTTPEYRAVIHIDQGRTGSIGILAGAGDVDGDGRDDLGANVFERGSLLIEGATSSAQAAQPQ